MTFVCSQLPPKRREVCSRSLYYGSRSKSVGLISTEHLSHRAGENYAHRFKSERRFACKVIRLNPLYRKAPKDDPQTARQSRQIQFHPQ